MLIEVEDYLSIKGVCLEPFYSIEINKTSIWLQGHYDSGIVKNLMGEYIWALDDSGYTVTRFEIPTSLDMRIAVTITLT